MSYGFAENDIVADISLVLFDLGFGHLRTRSLQHSYNLR
jgi:hypothetical protein